MAEQQSKRPASQYYWGDWWKDKGLHSCCLTARGLWHEMNCLMHEGEPYGHLTLNGRPMTVSQLANHCRITPSQCGKLLQELEDAGVPSRTPEGVIFSRRMVRDEAVRNARAAGGKAGAEHGSKGAEHGSKGGRPKGSNGGSETPLDPSKKPPPSSSSSSSSSLSEKEDPPATRVPPADAGSPPERLLTAMDLVAEGVLPQHAADWLKVRKAKKAPLTVTAWEATKREAALASISPAKAVQEAAERGWQGFKASWLQRDQQQAGRSGHSDVFAGAV